MTQPNILHSNTSVQLRMSPIEPSWVREGHPIARNAQLSRSADGTASTIVWDCTEGKFEWIYDFDETIYIVEGSVVIGNAAMAPRRFGPGDVVFFPKGSRADWHVEGYVRKVAFCRRTLPGFVGFALRALSKLKRIVVQSTGAPAAPSLMDAGAR